MLELIVGWLFWTIKHANKWLVTSNCHFNATFHPSQASSGIHRVATLALQKEIASAHSLQLLLREAATCDLCPKFPALPRDDAFRGLPSETQHADDPDFLSFDPQHLEQALEVCSDNLPKWNLQVSRDKTERTRIYLASKRFSQSW